MIFHFSSVKTSTFCFEMIIFNIIYCHLPFSFCCCERQWFPHSCFLHTVSTSLYLPPIPTERCIQIFLVHQLLLSWLQGHLHPRSRLLFYLNECSLYSIIPTLKSKNTGSSGCIHVHRESVDRQSYKQEIVSPKHQTMRTNGTCSYIVLLTFHIMSYFMGNLKKITTHNCLHYVWIWLKIFIIPTGQLTSTGSILKLKVKEEIRTFSCLKILNMFTVYLM